MDAQLDSKPVNAKVDTRKGSSFHIHAPIASFPRPAATSRATVASF
jgi:hypothetical protein